MSRASARGLGFLSNSVYKAAQIADAWLGLPAKASESLHFRQDWRRYLPSGLRPADSSLWIHGASVGELEDLGALFTNPELLARAGFDPSRLVLTASSVSAKAKLAEWRTMGFAYAGPLPPESMREMRAFLYILQPRLLVLSHSDLWPVALTEAARAVKAGCLWLPARVPERRLLVDGFLRGFARGIGCRSDEDNDAFRREPLDPKAELRWIGNPRIDRILRRIERARAPAAHPLEAHGGAPDPTRPSLIVGSAWLEDARILEGALAKLPVEKARRLQVVALPHETRDTHLVAAIKRALPEARVLPVQGVLAEAYRDFTGALVGGGYRTGLHNVLEPALWEIPIFCGPDLRKQPEASMLRTTGQLQSAASSDELASALDALFEPAKLGRLREASRRGAESLRRHEGAALRLADLIRRLSGKDGT